jgi:hypothetical protein
MKKAAFILAFLFVLFGWVHPATVFVGLALFAVYRLSAN